MQITQRVIWRSNKCNLTTIGTVIVQGAQLQCESGCVGNIDHGLANCTDISVADRWNVGEIAYTYVFSSFSTDSYFEAV